ncbi:hypothetical protein JSO19_05245 [Leucobacter sp. UCMA 4100]|uniref:hypothetical protein n=1 Tax=Leucobacter sp. UCMA 4100 TaxID=2810534 RepID=UPI0022EB45F5|nr:hypothetical protein [Leucobacter sp. UCMA 4100]MDA3146778.1 hypothetical protein [Leucobacter sp. UCMA 4100]
MTTTPEPVTANYLKGLLGKPALTTLALVAAVVFGVAAVMALLIVIALMASSALSTAGLGTLLSLFACVTAGVLGYGWAGNGSFGVSVFSLEGSFSLSIFSLTTLAAIAVGTALIAKRRLAHDGLAPTLTLSALRAGIEGAVIGLVFMLVFGFIGLQPGSTDVAEGELHGKPFAIFATLWCIVAITLFVTRERTREASPITAFFARPLIAETRAFFAATFTVFAPLLLVALVLLAIKQTFATSLALIPFLGNLLLGLISMGYLGGFTAEVPFTSAELLMPWNLSPWLAVCVYLFAALSIMAAAIAVGLRRPRAAQFRADLLWRLPVGATIIWLVVVLVVLPIRTAAGMGSYGTMTITMTVTWWVPFSAAAVALLVSALAEFAPRWAYLANPKLLFFFASQHTVNRWLSGEPTAAPAATVQPEPTLAAPAAPIAAALVANDSIADHAAPAGPETPTAETAPIVENDAADEGSVPTEGAVVDEGTVVDENAIAEPASMAELLQPQPQALPLPERAPLSPQKKRGIIAVLVTVVAVVVALVAGLVTVKVLNGSRGPEAAVEHYLSLIAKGKLEAATDTVDPGVRNTERGLLTTEVFDAADHQIEVVSVGNVDEALSGNGTHALVGVELSIDGERQSIVIEAERGANSFGLLHNWEVTTPLVQRVRFEAPFEFDTIEVGDTKVEVGPSTVSEGWDERHVAEAYLYPGEYTFSIPNGEYTEFETVTMTVMPQQTLSADPHDAEPVAVEFEATASESLKKAVLALVNDEFTKCVTIPTNMESYCPYIVQNTDLAVLELGTLPGGFETFDFSSFETEPGTVKTQRNSTEWSDYDLEETKVSMRGSYSVVDGKVIIDDVSASTSFWG